MDDRFTQAENIGRNLFEKSFPTYSKDYSKDKYSFWDVSGYTNLDTAKLITKQAYIAEIKVRENTKHNAYSTVILEEKKYNALMEYSIQSGIPAFYVCYYSDAVLICNLAHLDKGIELTEIDLPATSKQDSALKTKSILNIPLSYFKIIKSGGYNK